MLRPRRLAVSLVVSLVVGGVLVAVIGVEEFLESLSTVPLAYLLALVVVGLLGIVAMGLSFYVIARSLDLGVSPLEAIVLYAGIGLANNVTPFGQAGGEPIGAMLVAKRSRRPYEACLAAISSLDAINFVPPILVFVLGGGYLLFLEPAIPAGLRPIFGSFVLFVLLVLTGGVAIRTWPGHTRRTLERIAAVVNRILGRVPGVRAIGAADLRRRVGVYIESVGVVARNRRTVFLAVCFSTLAFVAQGLLLWLAMLAVHSPIPLVLAIFIVPVSLLAGIVPLPGGGGGVEGVQILLVLGTAGVALAPTVTAIILSRGIVYWLPIVLGSATIGGLYSLEEEPAR